MKRITSFLIAVAVVIFVLILAKNALAKMAVEAGVRVMTGLPLKMDEFDVSLLKTYVKIKGMRLYNPSGYPDRVMMEMPIIFVDFDPAALLKNKIHVEDIQLHLKDFTVVKNEKGALNLDALKPVQTQKKEAARGKTQPAPGIQVDNLMLRIEKVTFKDYTAVPEPSVREFDVNINEEYHDIQNLNLVVSIIVVKIMMNTPLGSLTNFNVDALKTGASQALASSRKLASGAATKALNYIDEGDFSAAKETVKGASSQLGSELKDGYETVKTKFTGLFSKKD